MSSEYLRERSTTEVWDGSTDGLSYTFGTSPKVVRAYSISELLSLYESTLWEDGHHRTNVRSFLGEINEIFLGRRFSTISQELIDDLVACLRERGNSNATINRKLSALSKLLRKACKMGDLHSLPEFRRQKERRGRIRFLEYEEEDRLFEAIGAQSLQYKMLSIFLFDTGARLGEAISLRWNDVHDGVATFWLTKSGRSRSIPLTGRACRAVEWASRKQAGPFAGIKQYKYRAAWHNAKADVGLADDLELVPHSLRHTCASRLVRGGVDIRRVQMWLGHQTLQMTMRYAHLATQDLDVCVPILEHR